MTMLTTLTHVFSKISTWTSKKMATDLLVKLCILWLLAHRKKSGSKCLTVKRRLWHFHFLMFWFLLEAGTTELYPQSLQMASRFFLFSVVYVSFSFLPHFLCSEAGGWIQTSWHANLSEHSTAEPQLQLCLLNIFASFIDSQHIFQYIFKMK